MAKRKTEEEIKALVAHEISSAIAYDSTELSDKRARAIEYYYGEMKDTPAAPNRSSVVSRDTSDVIGWMLPGLMRTFMASGRIVEYESVQPEDEAFASQASDYMHYIVMRENDGYRLLYNATHDALLHGNGIVKHYWDDYRKTEVSEHTGLTERGLVELLMKPGPDGEMLENPDIDVLSKDQRVEMAEDGLEYTVFDVKIERTKSYGKLCMEVIEPENFLMDKDMVVLEEARFCAHRQEKTRSDLIEMGFERDKVEALPGDRTTSFSEEGLARDGDRVDIDDSKDESTQLIELFECYLRADVDGDGVSEIVRVYYAGSQGSGEMLDWEVWDDEFPFTDIPCEPVPHRWDAQAISDLTMDMQRVKTVLFRNMLDNVYAHNKPQVEIEEGSVVNLDSLVSPKFGQPIIKKRNSAPIKPHSIPFVADKALLGIQHVDDVIERRTGVSRSTAALDPEALNNQTATAVQDRRDAAYSKVELVARNMAELGWKKVFRKGLRLIVNHQDRAKTIRLRGEWVEMDPRGWNADMDCTVNTGLGTGSRDRDMAMLNTMLGNQTVLTERLVGAAPQSPTLGLKALEMLPKLVDTMTKIGESAGIRNADDYYVEFAPEDLQQVAGEVQQAMQGREDPKIAEARAKIEADREKAMVDMALEREKMQAKGEMEAAQAARQHEIDQMKVQADREARQYQIEQELALKREQLVQELQLKREQIDAEMQLKRELAVLGATQGEGAATRDVQVGGDPG